MSPPGHFCEFLPWRGRSELIVLSTPSHLLEDQAEAVEAPVAVVAVGEAAAQAAEAAEAAVAAVRLRKQIE